MIEDAREAKTFREVDVAFAAAFAGIAGAILFLAGAASSVFGGDVFWEYVCESKVLHSDKKKEYAIRSQEAFQAFSQTAKLTPENLDFIRTQGSLRGIDFEQSLWYNPDLSYDALNHVSPQSAVLRTAFEISKVICRMTIGRRFLILLKMIRTSFHS